MASPTTPRTTVGSGSGSAHHDPSEPSPGADPSYMPRRSHRVHESVTAHDGDTWHESLSVCEGGTASGEPRLILRSYFVNARTHQRIWDEPPTGASRVVFAAAEKRNKAQAKMAELQDMLDMIPPEPGETTGEPSKEAHGTTPKTRRGVGGFFQKFRKKEKPVHHINEAQDVNLQRAIARSMVERQGRPLSFNAEDDPVVTLPTDSTASSPHRANPSTPDEDDEDLALAKALSISSQSNTTSLAATATTDPNHMSEDEQLVWALEQSRLEAPSQAAEQTAPETTRPACNEADRDRKMPAVPRQNPFDSPPSSPSNRVLADAFDPYSPSLANHEVSHQPEASADLLSLVLPDTSETLADAVPSNQPHPGQDPPRRTVGRRLMGNGRRKAMEDQAGVV